MAEVPVFHASFQIGDSNRGHFASGSFRVSEANAKLYLAAADAAARAATNVGLLLAAGVAMTRAQGQAWRKKFSLQCDYINDAYTPPVVADAAYNSNKWKVTFQTTNAGVPALDTLYLPQYVITGQVMESDGISADLTDSPASVMVSTLIAHGLSTYGTAITSVVSIQRNDS